MVAARSQINRPLVGVLAIACLLIGAVIAVLDSWENIWCGSFVRVGCLMGAFWIALPTKGRAAAWENISPWWIVAIAGGLLFVVRRPRVLIPLGIMLFVLAVVIPKLTRRRK